MAYPKVPDFGWLVEELRLYAQLKHEYGARGIEMLLRRAEKDLRRHVAQMKALPIDPQLAAQEPSDYKAILKLRPAGPRRLWEKLDRKQAADKIEGALLARMAGCTLGAPVEFWTIERMQALAAETGVDFPPTDYWTYVPEPKNLRYGMSPVEAYTRGGMNGVPVDDDIVYTLLGLLVVEAYGAEFTLDQLGEAWLKFVPLACTAEEIALRNLKRGVKAAQAGQKDNPFCEWIGADIRSDPWAYMAPGWPEKAAQMAWRDAYLTHRRNGIYGEMFFAAAISAAFAVDDPFEALKLGLSEIPARCATARAVRWALKTAPQIKSHTDARAAVEEHFKGMHPVHTINNACLTIFGIALGDTDVSRVIGQTVAMGLDNDCTAATAGSLVGAIVGKAGVPQHWTRPFGDTVHSYLTGRKKFSIRSLVRRFTAQAARVYQG